MDHARQRSASAGGRVSFESLAPGSLAWVTPAIEPAIEDTLVRTAFRHLVRSGTCDAARARELGRVLGREKGDTPLAAFLDAFSHLGLGRLRLVAADADRFTFATADLMGDEGTPAPASCALALGFCEGLAETTVAKPTLGSEMTCRSRGDAECTFTVRARR